MNTPYIMIYFIVMDCGRDLASVISYAPEDCFKLALEAMESLIRHVREGRNLQVITEMLRYENAYIVHIFLISCLSSLIFCMQSY